MIADADMAQLNMVCVMDLHPATTVLTTIIVSIVVQVSMKAICFPTSTGGLFRRSIVNEISKIVGEKQHVWKICT